ncbi:hypothetical protein C1646_770530 [Rhizophagus diaphanus]|nr:hypothetical protein C1646_770530 [Rhizophagus diaphanus] [Rhizophagus sp. MUCL 43196]
MSCSKLGNLSELTYEVIKYFQNDYSTLHSCVLVNRLWCRLAIPLLWENPFSIPTGNYKFIEIYLHNLNGEYKINENLLLSNTLFNYPSFIKYLDLLKISTSVGEWFYTVKTENLDLVKDTKKLIIISLLKIFIENEVNLHTLEIKINHYYITYLKDILELTLQNPNFIRNAKNFKLSILTRSKNNGTLINNLVLQVIKIHQNLNKIILSYDNFPFYQSLLLSKDYNCSNTLNTITLYQVNFEGIINLSKSFEQLNVLESVHIIHCEYLTTSFIQQILNLTKPFKLKSLFINTISKIDESSLLLLQKYGGYLKNFSVKYLMCRRFGRELLLAKQILESVIKYCKNIEFLDIYGITNETVYPVLNLIENIKQNLNCLSINCGESNLVSNNSSILLQNLGQILPSKLEYLDLTFCIEISDFKVFLKNSQGTFIKKLLIRDLKQKVNYDLLPYLKKYIMKEKRVRYFNFRNLNKELFDYRDIVKEFKSHNIRVQKYYNLQFDMYHFMQNLD